MSSAVTHEPPEMPPDPPGALARSHNVFARLHALFPNNIQASANIPQPINTTIPQEDPGLLSTSPKDIPNKASFLKVRVLTWNMHDSLPKVCRICLAFFVISGSTLVS